MTSHPSATDADIARLHACAPIADLSAEARDRVIEAVSIATVPAGQDIITQGSQGDAFYVLLDGRAEVSKESNGKRIELTCLEAGAYFGEQALLGRKSGQRAATVRAIDPCRVGSITADVFNRIIAATEQNRDRFENDASAYVYREINKSLNSFAFGDAGDMQEGVGKRTYESGEILVREGDRIDWVFLILSGVAVAFKKINGQRREVARMGIGQIFGELGVLKGDLRAATVVADGDVEVLQISPEAFIRWHESHPDVSGFFNSLSNVYKLSQGRKISVFLGEVGGAKAVTSVLGRPTDGVVSTRVLDQGVVVFTNAGATAVAGERAAMHYADDRIKRELRVIVRERKAGRIERCVVYAVSAEGIENDLGTLYQHVLHLDEVQAVALRRFERTGFLGGAADKSDRLCPCLGLGPAELSAAAQELGTDYETLQANIGVGSICGGCEPAVCAYLEQCAASARAAPGRRIGAVGVAGASGTVGNDQPADPGTAPVADVPPDLLTRDETQLAALFARGMGPNQYSVTREQLAVRLRATGVRDMNFFIDMLFPGVFTRYARATYATLATAVGRGIGFGNQRAEALAPTPWHKALAANIVQRIYRLGRIGVVASLSVIAGMHFLLAPVSAAYVWAGFLALLALAYAALSLTPSGRFLRTFITAGPGRFYRALWTAFGQEETLATLRLNPFGKPIHIVRDERLVDYVLQHPEIYARTPLTGYPAFAEHSVLGGGSSGVWLGYRMLCEEYFAERYREDLDDMRLIVRERLAMWKGRESIDLLREIYRIVIEIHARTFFQTSFDCFNDNADIDWPDIIDRALGTGVMMFNDPLDGDIERLRKRCLDAVRGSTRPDSIGGILRDALLAGDINEREACENAVMYMLAQAPTMGSFWTVYRAVHDGTQATLRENRKELVKAIKEELRLHAPVTTMFTRTVLRADTLGGRRIEAGSSIIMSPMYIHTNRRQWTSPYQHDPQRWSASIGDGKEIVDAKTDPADAGSRPAPVPDGVNTARYVPYGGGGQACQGRWYASDEMLVVIEEILNSGALEIIDDKRLLEQPLHDQVVYHVYNRPFNDVRMRPSP